MVFNVLAGAVAVGDESQFRVQRPHRTGSWAARRLRSRCESKERGYACVSMVPLGSRLSGRALTQNDYPIRLGRSRTASGIALVEYEPGLDPSFVFIDLLLVRNRTNVHSGANDEPQCNAWSDGNL